MLYFAHITNCIMYSQHYPTIQGKVQNQRLLENLEREDGKIENIFSNMWNLKTFTSEYFHPLVHEELHARMNATAHCTSISS